MSKTLMSVQGLPYSPFGIKNEDSLADLGELRVSLGGLGGLRALRLIQSMLVIQQDTC